MDTVVGGWACSCPRAFIETAPTVIVLCLHATRAHGPWASAAAALPLVVVASLSGKKHGDKRSSDRRYSPDIHGDKKGKA